MRQRIVQQVARLPDRRPRAQQRRAAYRTEHVVEQPVGGEAGIFACAETHGDIDVVLLEVAQVGRDIEAQFDVGMGLAEGFDAPHQPFGGELRVGAEPELAPAALHPACARHRAAEHVERLGRGFQHELARLRRPDRAAGAGEQDQPELVLDLLDLVADRRRRQSELVRGTGEVEVAACRLQRSQRARSGYRVHLILQEILDDLTRTTRFSLSLQ